METSGRAFRNTMLASDIIESLMIEMKDKIKIRSWYDAMKLSIHHIENSIEDAFDWDKFDSEQLYNQNITVDDLKEMMKKSIQEHEENERKFEQFEAYEETKSTNQ